MKWGTTVWKIHVEIKIEGCTEFPFELVVVRMKSTKNNILQHAHVNMCVMICTHKIVYNLTVWISCGMYNRGQTRHICNIQHSLAHTKLMMNLIVSVDVWHDLDVWKRLSQNINPGISPTNRLNLALIPMLKIMCVFLMDTDISPKYIK